MFEIVILFIVICGTIFIIWQEPNSDRWYDKLGSSSLLTKEERDFLDNFPTEEFYYKVLYHTEGGRELIMNSNKLYLKKSVMWLMEKYNAE